MRTATKTAAHKFTAALRLVVAGGAAQPQQAPEAARPEVGKPL